MGEYAYKLKKPVRFAFLDYSTEPLRRAACETELALNRRWAPTLYLGLSELTLTRAGARLDAGSARGEPVVRMRRFDRAAELDRLIEARAVAPPELAAFGGDLARWQAAGPAVEAAADFGHAADALAAARDNLAALEAPGTPLAPAALAELRAWIGARHLELALLLAQRRARGRVRECHGDLHARNVVRLGTQLTPFDAIDFDARLRWIDVASDAAFLAMDLERLGRADLAAAFLDGWLAASGDYEAAGLMPWFLAYRALVRAKVEALRARQQGPSPAAEAAWLQCAALVRLARGYATRPPGMLVITCGPSGSGKSSLAALLVPALPALRLRSDVERKRLAGLAPHARSHSAPNAGLYTPAASQRTYAQLARAAERLLRAGFNVIVDAAFLDAAQRHRFASLAAAAGAGFVVLECTAPRALLRARVAARQGDASEATVAILERQLESFAPLAAAELAQRVRVDSSGAVDAAALAASLRAAAAPPGGSRRGAAPAS